MSIVASNPICRHGLTRVDFQEIYLDGVILFLRGNVNNLGQIYLIWPKELAITR